MNWRRILFTDLGELLPWIRRARGSVDKPVRLPAGKRRRVLRFVTEQLEAIVRTNSPMVAGLEAAAFDAPNLRLKKVLLKLRDDIAAGLAVAEAMASQPRVFPKFYTDLVRTGERTGGLERCLTKLDDDLIQALATRSLIMGPLIYAMLLVTVLTLSSGFITVQVVPVLADLVDAFEQEPPRSLRILMAVSDYLRDAGNWPTLAGAALGILLSCVVCCKLFQRRGSFNNTVMRILMGVPIAGKVVAKHNLARVSLVLEQLLAGGVPLSEALGDAGPAAVTPLFGAALRRAKDRVERGETLQAAMEGERLLPASFRGLVSIGESSGLLPEALGRIARLYARDVAKTAKIAVDIASSIAIVGLGCVVLVTAVSLFALLTQIVDTLIASM